MFGAILERPGLDRAPRDGERFYCEDWQCPALWECEHAFGRTYAYEAFIPWWEPIDGPARDRDKTPFYTPDRAPFAAQCRHFRRDKPREWLRGHCEPMNGSWCCSGCNMPECPRANNVTQLFPVRGAA